MKYYVCRIQSVLLAFQGASLTKLIEYNLTIVFTDFFYLLIYDNVIFFSLVLLDSYITNI